MSNILRHSLRQIQIFLSKFRYADKQLRWLQLKSSSKTIENTCLELLQKKQRADSLVSFVCFDIDKILKCHCCHFIYLQCSKIRLSKDRIQTLRLALEEARKNKETNIRKLTDLKHRNYKLSISLPKYEDKVEKLGTYVAGKREDIQRNHDVLANYQQELKTVTKLRIQQLINYIFPISKVEPKP